MLAAIALQSAPASLPVLRPSGPWKVEYADQMCVLQRQFGSGAQQITFGMKPAPLGDQVRLVALLAPTGDKTIRGTASVRIDDGPEVREAFAASEVKARNVRALVIDVKREQILPIENAKQLRIRAGAIEFVVAPYAAAAMKALGACEKDLLVSWGMDARVLDNIATFASIPDGFSSIYSDDDYPHSAIRNEEQGTVGMRYDVDATGKPSNCKVVESSGSDALDQTSCRVLLRRGKFVPARTRDGQPVASVSYSRISWLIPSW